MTPEIRRAQQALDDAIKALMELHGYTGPKEGVITDWIVVVAQEGYEDDGDVKSGYTSLYSGGSMATHKALGLLRCGLMYIELVNREDDD